MHPSPSNTEVPNPVPLENFLTPPGSRRAFVKRMLAVGAAVNLPGIALGNGGDSAPPWEGGHDDSCEDPQQRRYDAFRVRYQCALQEYQQPLPKHKDNGDEERYPSKIASFTKGLPHNELGEVDLRAYKKYSHALCTGEPADFERIPMGCPDPSMQMRLVNPQSGLAYVLEGIDPHATYIPPAPKFTSAEEIGELIELYWMALAREINFRDYETDPLIQQAAADLSRLSDFRGPKVNGAVTPGTIFRGNFPGCLVGPYISQFLYLNVPYGALHIDQRMHTVEPGQDFMTDYAEWLNIQNGCFPELPPERVLRLDPVHRYIRNGRDMGQWVHVDVLHEAYYLAMLILQYPISTDAESSGIEGPVDPNNPYLGSRTQEPFGTFGTPHLNTLVPEVGTRALKVAWFQKWYVHRRIRPEEYAGRVHNLLTGAVTNYPIPKSELLASPALSMIYSNNQSYLLPMAFPEGCPVHPAYTSGHATVAGACVTILKAWFDESYNVPNPVQPSADGLSLEPYSGPPLTIGGELNKLATNIAFGRNFAGVHWRSCATEGLKLGEAVAISILRDQKLTYNEYFRGFKLTKFDGTTITI